MNRVKEHRVDFAKVYVNAPVIHLATSRLDVAKDANVFFDIALVSVGKSGFVFTCKSWDDAAWVLDDLWVSWVSVPQ